MKTFFFLGIMFVIAMAYRTIGIFNNQPFWVDEYSSANQARIILENGLKLISNSSVNIEQHNFVIHAVIALFFKLFGEYEWVARFPFVIIGSLIPALAYLLARKLYETRVAVLTTLLITFSYFQIAWSRQARGYVVVQLLVLSAIYFYQLLKNDFVKTKRFNLTYLILLATIIGIGFFTHALFLIFLGALTLDIVLFNFEAIKKLGKSVLFYIFLAILTGISIRSGHLNMVIDHSLTTNIFNVNNIWYYHSFLWREYGLISFLSLIGLCMSLVIKKSQISLIVLYIIAHLLFINFLFSAYVSRYVLPIFPLMLMFMSYSVVQITDLFLKHQKLDRVKWLKWGIPLALILFIIINGHKFAVKPKQFYSVNHDFREIAIIDYHQVYNIIKTKGRLSEGKTAVIDTWYDRLYWYLGRDYQASYMFRWIDEPGTINGLLKKVAFFYNDKGEKIIPKTQNLRLIGELKDLKMAMKKYPRGFIFIDDASLPKDVIDYAEKNFKKELYLDHYPLDDNPYSIWPATLYSWGIN